MFCDEIAQKIPVDVRMSWQKRCAKTGGEGSLWIYDTLLSTRDFRCVARHEVIHRLGGSQFGDRRHHAKCIGRQHHQIFGMTGFTAARSVADEFHGICRASVLSFAAIIEIAYPCLLYTSDAADDLLCVDLGGRRIIKKKK